LIERQFNTPPEYLLIMTDYGYGDAAPDSAEQYGYGDAAPDTDLGYGDGAPDAAPDYGYGDASPDDNNNNANNDDNDLGYGDAAPDSAAANNANGEIYHMGYNDGAESNSRKKPQRCRSGLSEDGSVMSHSSNHSAATAESYGEYDEQNPEQPRRQRYRRRGSVTKFSLTAQDTTTVKDQYDAHSNVISQYRGTDGSSGDAMQPTSSFEPGVHDTSTLDEDHASDDGMGDMNSHKKKGRGKKLLKGIKQMSRRRFSTGYDL
jgi:hypothetical protein